jgi:hypothetical protein
MTLFSFDGTHWAMMLGILTLTCWIAGGITAGLGTSDEIKRGRPRRASGYATTCLTGAGLVAAVVMVAILAFA